MDLAQGAKAHKSYVRMVPPLLCYCVRSGVAITPCYVIFATLPIIYIMYIYKSLLMRAL